MLRLTILLCFGMLAALFTLGDDRGQLRPGLAKAEEEGRLDEVWADARGEADPMAQPTALAAVAEAAPAIKPVAEPPAPATLASAGPAVADDTGRNAEGTASEPVFTLSALGEAVTSGDNEAVMEPAFPDAVAGSEPAPEPGLEPAPAPAGGTIWYVTADSVNVRASPSTEAEVLGRLGNGEATLLVAAVDNEWGRIVIQGDGVEGYVAMRYLSPNTP